MQQVTTELKAEVGTLKEQLEREKKTSSEVKSLKTQQVCTLTFKLANAVRQRERAEKELATVQKEMEELKEVVKSQKKELYRKGNEDEKNVKFTGMVDLAAQNENVTQAIKESKDDEEAVETQEEMKSKSESLTSGELTRVNDRSTQDGYKNVQQQVNKTEGNKEVIKIAEEEPKPVKLLIQIQHDKNVAENAWQQPSLDETNAAIKYDETKTGGKKSGFSCGQIDGADSLRESPVDVNDSLYFGVLNNDCNNLLIDNSSLENSPQAKIHQDYDPQIENSPLSSLELSEFENLSILDNNGDSFHHDDFQNSSSEIYVSSRATSSFETCEEFAADDKENITRNICTQGDICPMSESSSSAPNVDCSNAKDLLNTSEKKDEILEEGLRKNRRMPRSEDSSPPTSPGFMSSGYISNGADDGLTNSVMHLGMTEDHVIAMHPGMYCEAQEGNTKKFAYECKRDDVFTGTEKARKMNPLKDLVTKDQTTLIEKSGFISKANAHRPEKYIEITQEKQNDFSSQNMSDEVEELKQQLKSALKEIEDLRLENKEMRKEMQRLSSSAEENAFLLKTTQFTDRLLREMREREARVHVSRAHATLENYGLERDFGHSGNPEFRKTGLHKSMQRKEDLLNRSARRKASLPLKLIGAKLKEITRSVENMAMDPDLSGERLSKAAAPDFVDYEHTYPNLNDYFEVKEQLIIPAHSSESFAAQSTSLEHEIPREISLGSYTSVENLEGEMFNGATNTQNQVTERDDAWKEKQLFQFANHAQDLSGFENCWNRDSRDYVQRYIVRSSDYIAKLRDLKPEEIAFHSKFR